MGSYGGYWGNGNIEEDKKDIFNQQMIKVLNYGGMMSLEYISMYGHSISLLKPFALYPGERRNFHYNYFEDRSWETATYDAEDAYLCTAKIGGGEFSEVVTAAYFLYEMYDSNVGFTMVDRDIVNPKRYLGWLNHLLGAGFSMGKRFRLWENVEAVVQGKMKEDIKETEPNWTVFSRAELEQLMPSDLVYLSNEIEMVDLVNIIQGSKRLERGDTGRYEKDVLLCKSAIIAFKEVYKENAYDKLVELLKMDKKSRSSLEEGALWQIGELSQYMPAKVFLYLLSEQENCFFWGRWFQIKDEIYSDEEMKPYSSEKLLKVLEQEKNKPVEKVRTSDFLQVEYWVRNVPEEVQKLEKVYTTDDDRLYWWDGTDEVIISEEAKQWLTKLGERHKELMVKLKQEGVCADYNFLVKFLLILKEVNEYYQRIFPFQSMFNEFLQNGNKLEYIAAIELFQELANEAENRKNGKLIKYMDAYWNWDLTDGRITRNKGRMCIKRYLAVMANLKLRKMYFDF